MLVVEHWLPGLIYLKNPLESERMVAMLILGGWENPGGWDSRAADKYFFNPEYPIFENHLLRGIVQFLDRSDLGSMWRILVTRVGPRSTQS
jgi:hypothetical protein